MAAAKKGRWPKKLFIVLISMSSVTVIAIIVALVWLLLWFEDCMSEPLPPIGHPR